MPSQNIKVIDLLINISRKALDVIDEIAAFVESKNTPGSGARYAVRFEEAIKKLAVQGIEFAKCNHPVLFAFDYYCSIYKKWVIVFNIKNDVLTVHEIIHGSLIY